LQIKLKKGTSVLENRDYTLVIDKSGSMSTNDTPGGKSRWDAAQESTFALASQVQKWDPDGLTLYTFASNFKRYENVTASKVNDVWAENTPMGGTELHTVLKHAFDDFLSRKKKGSLKENGDFIIVVTDGEPSDPNAVAKTIIDFTKKLDSPKEIGITFVQIGKDPNATRYLEGLDNNLVSQGAKYDIVGTVTIEDAESKPLSEILLEAIKD
jgi:uncharacterized protein with von Willebrand factor type A (vWA) domain